MDVPKVRIQGDLINSPSSLERPYRSTGSGTPVSLYFPQKPVNTHSVHRKVNL